MERRGYTEDGSDITPAVNTLMSLDTEIRDDLRREGADTIDPVAYKEKLKERLTRAFPDYAPQPWDYDILEDYNYHALNQALEELKEEGFFSGGSKKASAMEKTAKMVQVHCTKCGEDFKLDVGDATQEEVEAQLAARDGFECPGHHVELSSPMNYWEIDWDSAEEGSAPTDEEWVDKLRESYDEVYDTAKAVQDAGIEITSFAYGIPMARDAVTGKDIQLDFASAPSGKRYYYVISREASKKTAAEDYSKMTNDEFYDCLKDVLDDKSASELIGIGELYEILSEEFNNDILDRVGEDCTDEEYDRELENFVFDETSGSLLDIPGVYEVVSEEFNDEVLDCWDNGREASKKTAVRVEVSDILWDTTAEEDEEYGDDLPSDAEVEVPESIDEEDVDDYIGDTLADEYGFMTRGFFWDMEDEPAGYYEPTDTELGIDDREAAKKKKKKRDKHLNPDDTFKGGFEGCVNHFMNKKDFKPRKPGETKRDAAEAMCGYIRSRKGSMGEGSLDHLGYDEWERIAAVEDELTSKILAGLKREASKRLMFQEIRDWDLAHDTSFIRELEMTLEYGAGNNIPLQLQFFKDMEVYGLDEAIMYAEDYESNGELSAGTADELWAVADRIKKAMGVNASRKEANDYSGIDEALRLMDKAIELAGLGYNISSTLDQVEDVLYAKVTPVFDVVGDDLYALIDAQLNGEEPEDFKGRLKQIREWIEMAKKASLEVAVEAGVEAALRDVLGEDEPPFERRAWVIRRKRLPAFEHNRRIQEVHNRELRRGVQFSQEEAQRAYRGMKTPRRGGRHG